MPFDYQELVGVVKKRSTDRNISCMTALIEVCKEKKITNRTDIRSFILALRNDERHVVTGLD